MSLRDISGRPLAVARHRGRDTVSLAFEGGLQGEFHMRGGVSWPVASGPGASGYMLLAAVDIRDSVVHLFEETAFQAIDHITDHEGKIVMGGCCGWMNMAWQAYGMEKFFFHQNSEIHRTWQLNVLRSKMVAPKPQFIETFWQGDDEALGYVWNWVAAGRIVRVENTQIDTMLKTWSARPGLKLDQVPEMHALACIIAGLERYPWRNGARSYDEKPTVW